MKIYVGENYHDNDCGIWSELAAALRHFETCRCEIVEMAVCSDASFEATGPRIYHWRCENCGREGRSDQTLPIEDAKLHYQFCSEDCRKETEQFYDEGNCGSVGERTRQSKARVPGVEDKCYCWTTLENRMRALAPGGHVQHYKNCPAPHEKEGVTA